MADTLTIPDTEAETRLPSLLAEVAKGTEVVITRSGLPLARLVPAETEAERRERARRAAEGIRQLGATLSLGGLKIKDLIEEGRR
jgi:prevent-host-death family protein